MANYTIQSGDTLSKIAQRFGTTVKELADKNGISNPNLIIAGKQIAVGENKSNYDTYERSATKTADIKGKNNTSATADTKSTAPAAGTTEPKAPRRASNGLTMADAHKIYDAMCKKYDTLSKDTMSSSDWELLNKATRAMNELAQYGEPSAEDKDTSVSDSLLKGSEAQTQQNKTKSAAKGAVAGTILFPGLGTVVGGIIGWISGK